MRLSHRISPPTIVLFAYTFFAQFISVLYADRHIELSIYLDLLGRVAFLWIIWWWLKEDSRKTGVTWPLDLGMFLAIAWIFVLPYHLIKTRGSRGLLGIIYFVGVWLAAWIVGAIVLTLLAM